MAVFKQELNWSLYQENQMKVLESIERSLTIGSQAGQHIVNSMSKTEYALTAIANASEANAKNLAIITKDLTGQAVEFTSRMDKASTATKEFTIQVSESSRVVEENNRRIESSGHSFARVLGQVAENIYEYIGGIRNIGREVDNISAASNQMIRLSGMTGEVVREFRAGIMATVGDLNSSTGYAFSPSEAYRQIISISQGVTSDLEAIGEMARPLLLAQETLDVNINSIADLFNRFYTKYNFSSTHMESALDEIRGNTAGNSADAEATIENIQALEKWINVIAKDDNAKREQMLEEISHYTSWLESMGMNSAPYTNYLEAIAYGDWGNNKELLNILSRSNISTFDAQNMLSEGRWGEITEAIVMGMRDMISDVQDSRALGRALDNLGIDRATAMENWATVDSTNFTSFDDFLSSVSGEAATMEALVEDKYVSLADKTNHLLEQIYAKVASIQEYLPLGVSDILMVAALGRGLFSGGIGLGSTGNTMVAGSGVLGRLASGGYNMAGGAAAAAGLSGSKAALLGGLGVAGIGTGLGLAVDGGVGIFNGSDAISKSLSGIEAAAGLTGAGALTASMLGAGAAAGPIGWIALAVGGMALVGKSAYEAATKIGSAGAIADAYDQATEKVLSQSKKQENALLDIKVGLKRYDDIISSGTATEKELVEANQLLEEKRADLINLGILSESDIATARQSNIEGLQTLTEAYLKATDQWSTETTSMMNKYKKLDLAYASSLHGNLNSILQDWNDSGALTEGSDQLKATESLLFELYQSLDTRVAGGETLDKDTNSIYSKMSKAFKDGSLNKKEANSIIDSGLWNSKFLNANFSAEDLIRAAGIMSVSNASGRVAYQSITKGLGSYYGAENTAYVADVVSRIKSRNGIATIAEAEALLEDLKNKGFTSAVYPEIADAAAEWGLKGYAEGTNYVTRDQLALIHEGEAIVPKRYNPAANNSELRVLLSQLDRNSQEAKSYLSEFIEEIRDIREFLALWKEDNDKKEKISAAKSKHELSRAFVSQYMSI